MVRSGFEAAGFDKVAGRRVVLTGGASQLTGVREFAATMLDKQVRMSRPRPIDGLAEAAGGPAFSTCAGLLNFSADNNQRASERAYRPVEEASGRLGRLGQWLRENF